MSFNPLEYPICFEKPRLFNNGPWSEHLPFAFLIVQLLEPGMFVELGTFRGESYCAFCQAVETLELDTKCYAVDTWAGDEHGGFYAGSVFDNLQAYHDPLYGRFSTLIRSTFDQSLDRFEDGSIDLLHIDGLHTYDAVKHDFNSWMPKMSHRGVIMFHDTAVKDRDFGVWRFWDEIRDKYPGFEFAHGSGLGVLAIGAVIPEKFKLILSLKARELQAMSTFFNVLGRYNGLEHTCEDRGRTIAKYEATLLYPRLKKIEQGLRKKILYPVRSLLGLNKDRHAKR